MELKRALDDNEGERCCEDVKRRRLNSVREMMGIRCMQRQLPDLEPFLRRVVQEEVQSVLIRYSNSTCRLSDAPSGTTRKRYQLHFQGSLPQTIFTGNRIDCLNGQHLRIVVLDAVKNQIVTSGPFSFAKIEIVVLEGDFSSNEQLEWTEKDFCESILCEREGKRPLLSGEVVIPLIYGVGLIRDLSFTDNSSWIRSRKFRLGARISKTSCIQEKVLQAISTPFLVKDHRGETYKKNHPPLLTDEVWRLEKIGKDGVFHKRLSEVGINTVQDFLRSFMVAPEKLRHLLGSGMSNKMWETTVEHAQQCVLDDRLYYICSGHDATLLFNCIYEPLGVLWGNDYCSVDKLTLTQKAFVKKLQQDAYESPQQILELIGLDGSTVTPSYPDVPAQTSSLTEQANHAAPTDPQGTSAFPLGFHELVDHLRQELLGETPNKDDDLEKAAPHCTQQRPNCLPSHSRDAGNAGALHRVATPSYGSLASVVGGVW